MTYRRYQYTERVHPFHRTVLFHAMARSILYLFGPFYLFAISALANRLYAEADIEFCDGDDPEWNICITQRFDNLPFIQDNVCQPKKSHDEYADDRARA